MKSEASKILEAALKLPPEARAAIAGSLIDSLDEAVDEDVETECDGEPASTDRGGEWLDDSAHAAEPMGEF